MGKFDELFEELKKKYSVEEIAESFMIPETLSEEEEQAAREELWELRMKRRQEMTEKEKLLSGLLGLKYQIRACILGSETGEGRVFSKYMHAYLEVTGKKQKELAEDISIHPSRLSRIFNDKEKISIAVAFRLENHSGDIIPALYWWKLMQKEVEKEIKEGKETRERERKNVKNAVL